LFYFECLTFVCSSDYTQQTKHCKTNFPVGFLLSETFDYFGVIYDAMFWNSWWCDAV